MKKLLKFIKERKLVTKEHTKKMMKISSFALIVVVLLLGILIGSLMTYSYEKIDVARDDISMSINAWRNFDLEKANISLLATEDSLKSLQKYIKWTKPFVKIPFLGKRAYAANEMVDSSLRALDSYGDVINITEDLLLYQDVSYNEIENKDAVIAKAGEMIDAIEDVYVNIQQVLATTHELGLSDMAVVEQFEKEFSRFQAEDFKLLRLMHNVVSKRGEQKFLLLMQNNTELRPTGGYIGNYGILTIKDGEVPEFFLRDSDYLDEEIDIINKNRDREIVKPKQLSERVEKDYIKPPKSLERFFPEYSWRFGDANWSPSFPQTAVNAEQLYNITFAQNEDEEIVFDGVIAFNPELVIDWLKVLGGVKIQISDDIEFTAESFDDTPQNLYPGDKINGKTITEKTYLVDVIAQEVRGKFTDSSLSLLLDLVGTLRYNLQDNNLMFYFNDPEMQNKLVENEWTGELKESKDDYLYVVDSNLSRLRLDHMVSRLINYSVEDVNGTYIATVELTYNFDLDKEKTEGLFDEAIANYNTYTRVYVPTGASLINYEGIDEVDVFNELDKTVLGSFISVKPNSSKTITLTYALPFIQNGESYELTVQKQPGNEFSVLRVSLPISEDVENFAPESPQIDDTDHNAIWQMVFDEDQNFVVSK